MGKKDERLTQKKQDTEPNEHLSNEDHRQTQMDSAEKYPKTENPLHDVVSSSTHQYLPTFQLPYTTQTTLEHPLGRYTFNIQQSSPLNAIQRQAPFLNPQQQQQQNPISNQTQIGQSQGTLGAGAFWLPPGSGFQATSTSYQPISPMAASDSNWQSPVVVGGASSGPEPISMYCYQSGYSYPIGFPGPWYSSTLWGQPQQSHPPYSLHYPACAGGYGYFSAPPPMFDSSLSGQPHQRGIISLAAKLSQKHQQMWEAQSAENVHLRATLSHMEAEMVTHRSRLMWLEAEVSSLKAQRDSAMAGSAGAGTVLAVQTSKRGRRKRTIASTSILPFSDDSQPRCRRRKPMSSCKIEPETKGLSSNNTRLKEEENGVKASNSILVTGTISIQTKDNAKISTCPDGSVFVLNESNRKLSTNMPTTSSLENQAHENPEILLGGVGPNNSQELKGSGKEENRKTAFSVLPQASKETNAKGGSAPQTQMWHSHILSDDCRRNMLDIRSHALYDDTNIVKHGGKVFSGWSFVNEDASEEHEDVILGSGKDEGEMEEHTGSTADEIRQTKSEDNFGTDPSTMISKALPKMNRW